MCKEASFSGGTRLSKSRDEGSIPSAPAIINLYNCNYQETIHKRTANMAFLLFERLARTYLTDQDEFFYWLEDTPEHIGQLNQWLQKFINEYNTRRSHQALDYKTPEEFVKLYQKS